MRWAERLRYLCRWETRLVTGVLLAACLLAAAQFPAAGPLPELGLFASLARALVGVLLLGFLVEALFGAPLYADSEKGSDARGKAQSPPAPLRVHAMRVCLGLCLLLLGNAFEHGRAGLILIPDNQAQSVAIYEGDGARTLRALLEVELSVPAEQSDALLVQWHGRGEAQLLPLDDSLRLRLPDGYELAWLGRQPSAGAAKILLAPPGQEARALGRGESIEVEGQSWKLVDFSDSVHGLSFELDDGQQRLRGYAAAPEVLRLRGGPELEVLGTRAPYVNVLERYLPPPKWPIVLLSAAFLGLLLLAIAHTLGPLKTTWGNRPSAQSKRTWDNRPSAQSTRTWDNRPSAQSTRSRSQEAETRCEASPKGARQGWRATSAETGQVPNRKDHQQGSQVSSPPSDPSA